MTDDADPILAAVEQALREQITAWWQTPPRLDLAADIAAQAHRRAVLAQRDDGERWAAIQAQAEYNVPAATSDMLLALLAALADAEIARRQAEADVHRLREQNKASSDGWTKRTAAMESQIAHTKATFEQAKRWVDESSDKPWWQESVLGKYAAVLMMERAEKAETGRDTLARLRDEAVGKTTDYAEMIAAVRTKAAALLDGELAHRSRDYGRGVAQATRDILAALDGGAGNVQRHPVGLTPDMRS